MLKCYDLLYDFFLNEYEVNVVVLVLIHLSKQTDIRTVGNLPMSTTEPTEVLRLKFAIVSVLVEKQPSADHIQQNVLLGVKVNLSLHLH